MKNFIIFIFLSVFSGCFMVQKTQNKLVQEDILEQTDPKIAELKEAFKFHKDKKYVSALNIFKHKADNGNDEAMYMLGVYNIKGYASSRDYAAALHYFKLAGFNANAKALRMAGYMYENGMGTKKDHKKAVRYYKLSAQAGEMLANLSLGEFYLAQGEKDKAGEYFTKACIGGVNEACVR
ncbi:tetratricopeptide repeat protein [Campylobacter sp. 9BO]|uniref:tetratricopeptide repeat protein n=1 Tax=Campylobacter sp. 9BO TaxID=3424759 RepID=UPI003D345B2A